MEAVCVGGGSGSVQVLRLCHQEKILCYTANTNLGQSQGRSELSGRTEKSLPLARIEPRFLSRLSLRLVSVSPVLIRLFEIWRKKYLRPTRTLLNSACAVYCVNTVRVTQYLPYVPTVVLLSCH